MARPSTIVAAACLAVSAAAGPTVWTAADGFSDINPSGSWSIGRIDGLGSPFSLHPVYHPGALARWDSGLPYPASYPAAVKNLTEAPIFFGGNVPIQPGDIAIAPGPDADWCSMRWTAPLAGEFQVLARFENQDDIGDGYTAIILVNGAVELSADSVNATHIVPFDDVLTLAAGDTIDFAVSSRTGDNIGDVAGLMVTITLLTEQTCPEDLDDDGDIDFADLNRLLNNFNVAGPGLEGDVDGDNDVDFADLNTLLSVFNTEC